MALDAGTNYFSFPPEATAAPVPLSLATVGDIGYLPCVVDRMDLVELACLIVTAPTVTAPVITFYRRPTVGTSTGEVVIGTLTAPVGTAIGKRVKKNIRFRVIPGDEVRIAVTTAATAGAGIVTLKAYSAGQAALEPNDILSA